MLKNNGFHNRHSPILRAFSPLSLFSGGAPGAWYDPSDYGATGTLFQDSAGTTPVTAVEQPVGLMLDKSQGLALGPALISPETGPYVSAPAGVTAVGDSALSIVDGAVRVTVTASVNASRMQIVFNGTAGVTYKVQISIASNFGVVPAAFVNVTPSSSTTLVAGSSVLTLYLTAVATGAITLRLYPRATAAASQVVGDYVEFSNISVKELPGNHAFQSTSASRPVLKIDGNGKLYLKFDGVDDSLSTNSISFTSTDKMSVFAGVRKLSDAAQGMVAEIGNDANNAFLLLAPRTNAGLNYGFRSKGTTASDATSSSSYTSPITNTLTGLGDISGDLATLRVNGVQAAQNTGDQGTGNFGNYPLYIGRRAGSSLPFNGQMYSMIIVGKAVTAGELSGTETYVNQKTGAY